MLSGCMDMIYIEGIRKFSLLITFYTCLDKEMHKCIFCHLYLPAFSVICAPLPTRKG